jgi:hypothetical protein
MAGGVDQRDELVHLEEGPGRLRNLHAHPAVARWISLEMAVRYGFVEDCATV